MDVRLGLESLSGLYPSCFILNLCGFEYANIKDEPIDVEESNVKINMLWFYIYIVISQNEFHFHFNLQIIIIT